MTAVRPAFLRKGLVVRINKRFIREQTEILAYTGFLGLRNMMPQSVLEVTTSSNDAMSKLKALQDTFRTTIYSPYVNNIIATYSDFPAHEFLISRLNTSIRFVSYGLLWNFWIQEALRSHAAGTDLSQLTQSQAFMATPTPDLPPDWDERRAQVLNRDGYECGLCGMKIIRIQHIHHIFPRALGGCHDITNLVALCELCHKVQPGHENMYHPGYVLDERRPLFHVQWSRCPKGNKKTKEPPANYRPCPNCRPLKSAKTAMNTNFEKARANRHKIIVKHLVSEHPMSQELQRKAWDSIPPVCYYRLRTSQKRHIITTESLQVID
ncbi:MAG: HNH endonuclease [Actinobacteria bacterium]|nr:HNH endonuclease [Actinomycetota bacterium]